MTHTTLILARDALRGWMDQPDTPAAYDASMQRAVVALAAIDAELAAGADERNLFHAAMRELGHADGWLDRYSDTGRYTCFDAQFCWEVWQVARAQQGSQE